jgi:hypothetical protein
MEVQIPQEPYQILVNYSCHAETTGAAYHSRQVGDEWEFGEPVMVRILEIMGSLSVTWCLMKINPSPRGIP